MFKRILALGWGHKYWINYIPVLSSSASNFMNTDGTQEAVLYSSLTMAFSFSSGSVSVRLQKKEKEFLKPLF